MADSRDPRSAASKAQDLISRGTYDSNPAGSALFVILRSLDPFLQFAILGQGLGAPVLHRLGLRTLPPGLPTQLGIPLIDGLGLSPYRLIILGMAAGSAIKQDIWMAAVAAEPMSVKNAIIVSLFNTVFNSINSYLFLLSATSASTANGGQFPQTPLIIGSTLYTVGILGELISELQRKRFKNDPKNKGKPYTGGLWSLARHINYGSYTLWRAGYALASGGWVWGGIVGAFFFVDFARRGVPILNEYCEARYGEQWEAFKRQTRWKLIPWVY